MSGLRVVTYHTVFALATACSGYTPTYLSPVTHEVEQSLSVLADAGADREILRGFPARLNGAGTYHPLARSFSVQWEQLSGEPVHLSNPASFNPTFQPPLLEQALTFRITADDGVWSTSDEVTLWVTPSPSRTAPRVAAGPDRYLERDEAAFPATRDLKTELAEPSRATWERIEPTVVAGSTQSVPPLAASIFRLSTERDGLGSAPDYVLLWSFDEERAGERAPAASLEAPVTVEPHADLRLDATDSADVNGDVLRYRWHQVQGPPAMLGGEGLNLQRLIAPAKPQALLFRLFVSDGVLESAPAEAIVVVTASGEPDASNLTVAPTFDQRAHAGNVVWLDAAERVAMVNPGLTYRWLQTAGESTELELIESGRYARLVAPEAPATLVYAVTAEVPDTAPVWESAPEVSVVEVVPLDDNQGPVVFLCASTLTPAQGQKVTLTGRIADPEGDRVAEISWSQNAEGGSEVDLINSDEPTQLCGHMAGPSAADTSLSVQVEFTPASSPIDIQFTLVGCDELGDCGEETLRIQSE